MSGPMARVIPSGRFFLVVIGDECIARLHSLFVANQARDELNAQEQAQ